MRPIGLVRVVGLMTLTVAFTCVGAAPASNASSPVSRGPWPERLLTRADIAPGAVLIPGSPLSGSARPFILGFEVGFCMEPCAEPLVRLDPRSGSLKVGPVVPPDSTIETVGGRVLVFSRELGPSLGTTSNFFVRALNLARLRLGPPVRLEFLGGSAYAMAIGAVSGTSDLWFGGDKALWLWDADTYRVVRRVNVADADDGLFLSPDGRTLYELGNLPWPPGLNSELFVREFDARTGRILATTSEAYVQKALGLTPVNRGIWVTTLVVGESSAYLLSSDRLRTVELPRGALPPNPQSPHRYSEFFVYDLGPFVLVQSFRGMTCLSPNTGSLRATAVWTAKQPTWTPVALIGHTLLAIEPTPARVSEALKVQVPAACFG